MDLALHIINEIVARALAEDVDTGDLTSMAAVPADLLAEGSRAEAGATIATVAGPARSLLTGERVALNLLQRMCGVATFTARYVEAGRGTKSRILDTRKRTPGLRALEKCAVRAGGGTNHRFALYDGVMLKDNHLAILASQGLGLADAVHRARASVGPMVRVVAESGVDFISVGALTHSARALDIGLDM